MVRGSRPVFAPAPPPPPPPAEVERLPDVVVTAPPRPPVVVASPVGPLEPERVAQPTGTLAGPELRYRSGGSLGATLRHEPGVSSSSFGPGAARPVIRGQGGERVRVLENGTGTLDVAGVSDDHVVPVDPTTSERIEVLRGPATLRFGSNAIGGVAWVEDGRVPDGTVERILAGRVGGALGSADDERSGFAVVTGRSRDLAWRVAGFARETADLDIPGLAKSRRLLAEEGNPSGAGEARDVLPNSEARAEGATAGASWIGPCGFVGGSLGVFSTAYDLPNEEDVRIEADRVRADARGRWLRPFAGILEASFALAFADYEHTEFEGDEVGTVFEQQAFEGRVELVHARWGGFDGAFGVQGSWTDLTVTGEEALLPEAKTRAIALFLVERTDLSPRVTFEVGGRLEATSIDSVEDETFLAPSVSAGLVWRATARTSWALSAAYATRAPTAIELYANGPHIATGAFEVGDAGLEPERSIGADLTFRLDTCDVALAATAFLQRYERFISLTPTGAVDGDSGLPVFAYGEHEASLLGVEGEATIHLLERCDGNLDLELLGDLVRGENTELDEPLPRMPATRLGAGLVGRLGDWTARVDVQRSFDQTRIASFELETDGFTRLDAGISRRFELGCGRTLTAGLTGTNLLDEEIRLSTSFTKDVAPERGRSVRFSLEFDF